MGNRLRAFHDPAASMAAKRATEPDAYAAAEYSSQTIDLLGLKGVLFIVAVGTVGASGTVDSKLQDSDNGSSWADVTGAAITQIVASDGAGECLAYTGPKRYVKSVTTVGVAECDVAVTCAVW